MEFAILGLGRMGGRLALNALEKGADVVGHTRSGARPEQFAAGLREIKDLAKLRDALKAPRVVFLYLPAGPVTENTLDQAADVLDPGDVLVDGGNSYWGDSLRRHARLAGRGLRFVDLGTSGGLAGARHGACFMAGGEKDAIAVVEPICRRMAVEGGFVHAGGPGAGHFVKLVHNGIEFGMLQAIAEGYGLLRAFEERAGKGVLDIQGTLECWRHGSVIRSWLVDLLAEAHRTDPGLTKPSTHIEDTGEVNWLVSDALQFDVPVPVIAQAVMALIASRDDESSWTKAIISMRHEFGAHPLGRDDTVAKERRTGRVGDLFRPAI